jgi:hypothetical protein
MTQHSLVGQVITNVSEKSAASILRVELET